MKAHGFSLVTTLAAVASLAAETVPPLPKDAQSLRKSYLDARERALQPIESRYRMELERLLASYTKAGKLDEALAIKAELENLPAEGLAARVTGKWQFSDASGNTSDVELFAGGSAIYRKTNEKGKWTLNGRTLSIVWENGRTYQLKVSSSSGAIPVLKGTTDEGKVEITMSR